MKDKNLQNKNVPTSLRLRRTESTLSKLRRTKVSSASLRRTEVSSASLRRTEPGFILAFALLVVGVLLTMALAVSKVVNSEMFFSRLVENSRVAYLASDSGIECAEYLDNVLKDESLGKSLFLNAQASSDIHTDFIENSDQRVFFSTSSVLEIVSDLNNVTCASDSGATNKIFTKSPDEKSLGFVTNRESVISNLNQEKASYTLVGDLTHATTTFGFILNTNEGTKCVLVDFAKTRYDQNNDATIYFGITSTGYSDCNPNNKNRVTRTIYRYSTD